MSRLEAGGIFVWAGIGIATESLRNGMEWAGHLDRWMDGWMDGWLVSWLVVRIPVRIRMLTMLRMREVKMKSRLRHA